MSEFTIHNHESAPQASHEALAALEKNLVANLADTPVDEPFEPQAWTAARSSPTAS